jgi:hypothetical protein
MHPAQFTCQNGVLLACNRARKLNEVECIVMATSSEGVSSDIVQLSAMFPNLEWEVRGMARSYNVLLHAGCS